MKKKILFTILIIATFWIFHAVLIKISDKLKPLPSPTEYLNPINALELELKDCFRQQDRLFSLIDFEKYQLSAQIEFFKREGQRVSSNARDLRQRLSDCEQKKQSCERELNQCINKCK